MGDRQGVEAGQDTAASRGTEPTLLMSGAEIKLLIGGYTQQSKQIEELRRQGFWRARRAPVTGEVILERAHYEAVCQGLDRAAPKGAPSPKLRPA